WSRRHRRRLRLPHHLHRPGAHCRGGARDPRMSLRPALRAGAGDGERGAGERARRRVHPPPPAPPRGAPRPPPPAPPRHFLDAETDRVVLSSELEAITGLTRYDLAR